MEPETRPKFTIGDLAKQRDRAVLNGDLEPAVVAGRYELGPVIGTGGSATVRRAWDRTHRRWVAVKLFHTGAAQVEQRRQRKELLILSGLRHPGLVALYDAGTHDGRPYLVMQLVTGPTLAARILYGPLAAEDVAEIGASLAEALAYVHSTGVTHRDLKPANVLLGPDLARLSDFGIAQTFDGTRVTASGVVVGTAAYLSPEQVRGEDVGPPADVFSLGLVLLEALTGNREYAGTMAESAVARLHRRPAIPDGLPGPLADLLGRMTDHRPDRRPSAAEAARELAAFRAGEPVPERVAEAPGRRRWPGVLGIGFPVAAVATAVVGALLVGGPQPRAPISGVGEPSAPAGPPPERTQHDVTGGTARPVENSRPVPARPAERTPVSPAAEPAEPGPAAGKPAPAEQDQRPGKDKHRKEKKREKKEKKGRKDREPGKDKKPPKDEED